MRPTCWRSILSTLAVAVVVLCTVAVIAVAPAVAPLSRSLPPDAGHGYRAVLVFQLEDCESTLAFARLFKRPGIAAQVSVTGLVVGSREQLAAARDMATERRHRFPIEAAEREFLRSARALGFRSTPFVVLVDRSGAVRYGSPAPRTPEEYLQMADVLDRLSRT